MDYIVAVKPVTSMLGACAVAPTSLYRPSWNINICCIRVHSIKVLVVCLPIYYSVCRQRITHQCLPVLLCLLRVLQLLCQLPVILMQSLIGGVALARFSLPAAAAHATRMKHEIMSVKSATCIICNQQTLA